MSHNLKIIIVVIVAANLLYFGWGLLSSDGGDADCETARTALGIDGAGMSCDWLCGRIDEVNANARNGGPPDLDQLKNLMTLGRCLKARDGVSCPCFKK